MLTRTRFLTFKPTASWNLERIFGQGRQHLLAVPLTSLLRLFSDVFELFWATLRGCCGKNVLDPLVESRVTKERITNSHLAIDTMIKMLDYGCDLELSAWCDQSDTDWAYQQAWEKEQLAFVVKIDLKDCELMNLLSNMNYELSSRRGQTTRNQKETLQTASSQLLNLHQMPTIVARDGFVPPYELKYESESSSPRKNGKSLRANYIGASVVIKKKEVGTSQNKFLAEA